MLVLRRKPGESVVFIFPDGTQASVAVLAVEGNRVKLGIQALPDVTILREELKKQEKREDECPPSI